MFSGINPVPFKTTGDLGGEWSLSSGDLRHRAVSRLRARADGTIVPRNSFTQPPRRKVDLRLQQKVTLLHRVTLEGIAEVFNVLNSPNWTITTVETSPQYLQRTSGQNRTAQLGFRITF